MRAKTNRHFLAAYTVKCLLCLSCLLSTAKEAQAFGLYLKLGPASLGNGGSNPLGIPPNVPDVELSLITDSDWEFSLGVPAIGAGQNFLITDVFYFGMGGGLVVDANGVGPGVYTAFGAEIGSETFRLLVEYKQAVAIATSGLLSPYALRLGAGVWF